MGVSELRAAVDAGLPLIDVVVTMVSGINYVEATAAINALSEDLDLYPHAHYGIESKRIGSATKEALERMFGCSVNRVPDLFYDTAAEAMIPDYEQCKWDVSEPTRNPLPEIIESLSITQPGNDDDGQWIDPVRVARDRTMKWELWRQDDGGNAYHIATYSTELTAVASMRIFEQRGHRQVYWVSAVPK